MRIFSLLSFFFDKPISLPPKHSRSNWTFSLSPTQALVISGFLKTCRSIANLAYEPTPDDALFGLARYSSTVDSLPVYLINVFGKITDGLFL